MDLDLDAVSQWLEWSLSFMFSPDEGLLGENPGGGQGKGLGEEPI